MVTDADLLRDYLDGYGPEAGPWNLSPECLYAMYRLHESFREQCEPSKGIRVLNVGIGAGAWDEYLGYWTHGHGTVTSVDIDAGICDMFRYRQQREKHPNPSAVVCQDITGEHGLGRFDIVTAVGSTIEETGNHAEALDACIRAVREGGRFFLMFYERNDASAKYRRYRPPVPVKILWDKRFTKFAGRRFRIVVMERCRRREAR